MYFPVFKLTHSLNLKVTDKDIYWSIHDLERVISRAFRTQDWRWLPWNIA